MISEVGREKVRDWGDRRRSFSIFKCSEANAEAIAEVLSESVPDLTALVPSDLTDLPESNGPVLLHSISSEEACKNADSLHRLIVRLIRWENQPIFLLSPDSRDEWERGNLWLGDGKIDSDGLRLDALTSVLGQDSVSIPDMSILDLVSDQPEMTYIEDLMAKALNAKGLSFTAQALIGKYHVDFLVEKNGVQVVVECDGRAYHSSDEAKAKDKERDSYLQERGYLVLRFTGGEINGSTSSCVEQIDQALDESQVEKSQAFRMDDNLDDSQQKAVFTSPGQVCVLAPAGSGKTKVLTNRGIHLVNEGFREHQILALAFNKKAREEMQKRLRKMGFLDVKRHVHTFNSYGVQLLGHKPYSLSGHDFPKHEGDRRYSETFFEILQGYFVNERKRTKKFNTYSKEAVRKTKGQLTPPGKFLQSMCQHYVLGGCPEEGDQIWSQIFEEFLQWQKDSDHLTFADQVYLAVRELAEDPVLRRQTQISIDALLIDEFQDLDAAQLMLVDILALGHGNLFVVGDDDQMIYGWRGADIERLRNFLKDPNTRKIALSTNYRSSLLVVRHAGYLISHNGDRELKNVRPKEEASRGEVQLFIGNDIAQECTYLVNTLNKARDAGFQWKELAVLVRYRELYRTVLAALDKGRIPVDFKDAAVLYSTRAGRAVVGYFTAVLYWPSPPKSVWSDILNVPNRFLSHEYVDHIGSCANPIETLRAGKSLNDIQQKRVLSLLKQLEGVNDALRREVHNAHDLFQVIDTTFGLAPYFKKEAGVSDDNDAADYGLVVDQLREASKQFSDPPEFLAYCKAEQEKEEKEEKAQFVQGKDTTSSDSDKDAVALMTIHKAKGKEWRGVVLFHQEWRKHNSVGTLPEKEKKREEEEERRVVYVGATRAIEALWVTAERAKKSRFVDELFKDPKFEDINVQQEIQNQKTQLDVLEQRMECLWDEKGKEQIVVDRGQGMEQVRMQREISIIEQHMSFIRRLLLRLGLVPSRLKQLRHDLEVVTEVGRARQRIAEIEHEIGAKNATIEEVEEAIDSLDREEQFRRVLSYREEETQDKDKVPF